MNRTVFLAHSISSARTGSHTEDVVRMARAALIVAGWTVRPQEREPAAGLLARAMGGDGPAIVASNVAGIANSDLLLIIAEENVRPSSVWVEAGIALAARVCGVVIAGPNVPLPFLVASSFGENPTELAPWYRIPVDLFAVPAELRHQHVHRAVQEALTWADTILA